MLLVVAFFLLGVSGSTNGGSGSGGGPELVLGLATLIPAVILLAPFCLSLLGRLSRGSPIAVRLALRDLDRYRARSGSALAAISIGVMIAVIISIVAAARYANILDYAGPNLASNQVNVYTPNGPGYAPPGLGPQIAAKNLEAMDKSVHELASALGARAVVELQATSTSLQHAASGRPFTGNIYVGTPALLQAFGVKTSQVNPAADILTMRPGLSSLSHMELIYGNGGGEQFIGPGNGPSAGQSPGGGGGAYPPCPTGPKGDCLVNPVIQTVSALPSGVSAPNTVITERVVHQFGLQPEVSGWLIETSGPLTAAQISAARLSAANVGMSIETKNDEPTSSEVINWATVFGIALALGILAMSVGLIRSETASELRTLTATGASSATRRTITATTAGALALLGAVLGTMAGYVGVIGWLRSNSLNGGISALGNIPESNLLIILVGMPLAATLAGWLLAGREPLAIARRPLE